YFGLAVSLGGSTSAGVSGSFGILLLGQSILPDTDDGTRASIGDPTAVEATAGTITVSASAPNSYSLIAGNIGIGSSAGAGVGAGVDVEVIHKTTTASIGANDTITTAGDTTVDATSSEKMTSISVGASFSGTAAVTVNAGVPVLNITTNASIGNNSTVNADGSVRVAAEESLKLDVIAGNI